jgi:DNA replication and repair protein RecF
MERDRLLGYSSTGPHRADWRIVFDRHPGRLALSRGQQKLVAMCCVLAQGHAFAEMRGEWPVIALDDFASELDQEHQQRVLDMLLACVVQVLMTGTELPHSVRTMESRVSRFHVEQGEVHRLL